MYTIVDGYAMPLWCDTEGKTWAAIAIMANFQSFVWWQRFFEIHTHDHHWRSVALIKQKQPATDGYDKKRLPPLIAPKNFFTQADKKRTACYFQYWINSFHRKYEQWYDVAWFSRFISPLRQKRVDMPWPLLAKSDALHFLQSLWCIAKNAQYSREKFSLESLLRIVSPQCIEISADSPIHKAEWPLFCISTFAMSHFLWTCYKILSWIIDRRETKTNSYISNSFWLCDFLGLDSRCLDIINVKR